MVIRTPFNPSFIVIHHSASDKAMTVEQIREYHLSRGWDDIGYHKLVDASGVVHEGRPLSVQGAHAIGFNDKSIGICCIGNFEEEKPSEEMLKALEGLLLELCRAFNIPAENVIGHFEVRQYAETKTGALCPGESLKKKIPELRKALMELSKKQLRAKL